MLKIVQTTNVKISVLNKTWPIYRNKRLLFCTMENVLHTHRVRRGECLVRSECRRKEEELLMRAVIAANSSVASLVPLHMWLSGWLLFSDCVSYEKTKGLTLKLCCCSWDSIKLGQKGKAGKFSLYAYPKNKIMLLRSIKVWWPVTMETSNTCTDRFVYYLATHSQPVSHSSLPSYSILRIK